MRNYSKKLRGKTVDITPLFAKAGLKTGPLSIIETPGMYPYKEKVEDNWAYFTAVGMQRLKHVFDAAGKKVKTAGIVGICSGVEAIALTHIFRHEVRHVIVTDVDAGILEGTMYNLTHTITAGGMKITPFVGSFCEPIAEKRLRVDFVHANIPNLPATGKEDLGTGAEKGTFLPAGLYEKYNPPKKM